MKKIYNGYLNFDLDLRDDHISSVTSVSSSGAAVVPTDDFIASCRVLCAEALKLKKPVLLRVENLNITDGTHTLELIGTTPVYCSIVETLSAYVFINAGFGMLYDGSGRFGTRVTISKSSSLMNISYAA